MAIIKEIEIGQMEITGKYKSIQVRTDTVIKEDGKELSRAYHRHVVTPDISAEKLALEHAEVQTVANSGIWTDQIKTDYQALVDNPLGE
jgi:hypothetical protein